MRSEKGDDIPVLIEFTMMSEERVSDRRWPDMALSEKRLIISGTSSSESNDLYKGLFFHVVSGGGGDWEGVWPFDKLSTGFVITGAVILTSLTEVLPFGFEERRLNCSTIDITLFLLPATEGKVKKICIKAHIYLSTPPLTFPLLLSFWRGRVLSLPE